MIFWLIRLSLSLTRDTNNTRHQPTKRLIMALLLISRKNPSSSNMATIGRNLILYQKMWIHSKVASVTGKNVAFLEAEKDRTKNNSAIRSLSSLSSSRLQATTATVEDITLSTKVGTSGHPSSPSRSPKDPLDLTFSDTKQAYKSKTTPELIRALVVLKLSSFDFLVNNSTKVINYIIN